MFSIHRIVALTATIIATLILVLCIPLMTQTMRTDGVNCGTVFASSDTWTYASTKSDPSSYYRGARSQADLEAGARAAVNDLMADLSQGASASEYCETRHSDRRVLLISLSSVIVLLLAGAAWSWRLEGRQVPASNPLRPEDESQRS